MKRIPLTKGKFALVDDSEFDFINQWKWGLSTSGYARRIHYFPNSGYHTKDNTVLMVWMHRVLNRTPNNLFTDHINQNKLDNRKSNLRAVTKSQNGLNRPMPKNNVSGHKGVYWDSWTCKWRAEMKLIGKKLSLGRFLKLEDAVKARKLAEEQYAI